MEVRVTENTTASSETNAEQAKLDLEKWRIEQDIQLRRDELEIKRKDASKLVWSSFALSELGSLNEADDAVQEAWRYTES